MQHRQLPSVPHKNVISIPNHEWGIFSSRQMDIDVICRSRENPKTCKIITVKNVTFTARWDPAYSAPYVNLIPRVDVNGIAAHVDRDLMAIGFKIKKKVPLYIARADDYTDEYPKSCYCCCVHTSHTRRIIMWTTYLLTGCLCITLMAGGIDNHIWTSVPIDAMFMAQPLEAKIPKKNKYEDFPTSKDPSTNFKDPRFALSLQNLA